MGFFKNMIYIYEHKTILNYFNYTLKMFDYFIENNKLYIKYLYV